MLLRGNASRFVGTSFRQPFFIPTAFAVVHNSSKRTLFIGTEATPNPHSMKFLPGREVLPENFGTGMYFELKSKEDIKRSPLAKSLFATNGIKSLFFGKDFVTVTKNADEVWHVLKPLIFSKILDFYAEGLPILMDQSDLVSDTTILPGDSEVVATIKELLETKIRPNVQDDGGDIIYEGYDEDTGIVKVSLAGSCVGCPSSSITLRNGVENMLMHYIPEVNGVEEVSGLLEDEGDEELILQPSRDVITSHAPPTVHDGGEGDEVLAR